MRRVKQVLLVGIVVLAAWASTAWAGGIWMYEMGTPDMGTASAGTAAMARDASTAFSNPAGMTRLDRSQTMVGLLGLDIHMEFDGRTEFSTWNNNTTDTAGNGDNIAEFTPAGSLNFVYVATPDLRLGLTAGSYFGLAADFGDDWQGRYYVQSLSLLTAVINPSAAYRVNDWLSVGGGVSALYGKMEQDMAINNRDTLNPNDPPDHDGQLKIDTDDWAWGYNLGLLLEPAKGTRIGVTYRSEVELEFEDVAKVSGVTGPIGTRIEDFINHSNLDLTMKVPQAVTVSVYQQVTDQLAVMANVGWQDWSEFGKMGVDLSTPNGSSSSTVDANFDDTWHGAVGLHYRVDPWLLMLGFAYDSSPVSDHDRSILLPFDRQYRYAAGVEYTVSKDVTVGFQYEYTDLGKAEVDQERGPLAGHLNGEFDTAYINAFGLNVNWKF